MQILMCRKLLPSEKCRFLALAAVASIRIVDNDIRDIRIFSGFDESLLRLGGCKQWHIVADARLTV